MLSSFLKKLLFARQFEMADGKIEILGKKQVMVPSDVIYDLQLINPKLTYNNIKRDIRKDIEDYARKLGSGEEGMLKNIDYLFETFGLGKMQVVTIDNKKKNCIIRVYNSPFLGSQVLKDNLQITPAVLSGIFSFLLEKDVDAQQTNVSIKGTNYLEYVIK